MTLLTFLPSVALFVCCWTLSLLAARFEQALQNPLSYRVWADTPLLLCTTATAALIAASLWSL